MKKPTKKRENGKKTYNRDTLIHVYYDNDALLASYLMKKKMHTVVLCQYMSVIEQKK